MQSVGGLTIAHSVGIKDLSGLGSLATIASDLVLFDNLELASLQGIGPFNALFNRLWIESNPKLINLAGLGVRQSHTGVCQSVCTQGILSGLHQRALLC